jgi:hypothetical protein
MYEAYSRPGEFGLHEAQMTGAMQVVMGDLVNFSSAPCDFLFFCWSFHLTPIGYSQEFSSSAVKRRQGENNSTSRMRIWMGGVRKLPHVHQACNNLWWCWNGDREGSVTVREAGTTVPIPNAGLGTDFRDRPPTSLCSGGLDRDGHWRVRLRV